MHLSSFPSPGASPAPPAPPAPVYLAGFDVFRADAVAHFARLQAQAAALGLQALVPTDGGLRVGPDGTPAEVAGKIREANLAMIRRARAVIANLAPFRGLEPDSGTVFEVGFAQALGLPVFAYGVPAAPYSERVRGAIACDVAPGGEWREVASGMLVEDFGLAMNLMLACGVAVLPDVEAALAEAARQLVGDRPATQGAAPIGAAPDRPASAGAA